MIFNPNEWTKKIGDPLWYKDIPPLIDEYRKLKKTDPEAYEHEKELIYSFFEKQLASDNIALGEKGPDWDKERRGIDTIVIHHTSSNPGLSPDRLSAMTLLRLYANFYAKPYDNDREKVVGQAIWSGHIRGGKQVFWPYHWIVRTNGDSERLLRDDEIGWHAGNWDINRRSVAIVLDNDYENRNPSNKELERIATIIQQNYRDLKPTSITGHCEVERKIPGPHATCPSKLFLTKNGARGWKEDLIALI
ncbi:MAG: hypothetical protein COV31_01725 [Candidatus Yanofskybacteria bacterium CG10_big_fil_rev_8_21_14_0_10_46_23]|uniref:N-acetylmuramoyl-L-alanine amidase domain-containing protein n=1 Tax=Candidatus Yanofskybacteria bacterium CG10_big_fil_rev_8_21_14_0_10_46_23 TaxID=1975098 RepID=A0A2H0R4S8_9BACT|nr:MAG: hypothetical protein COV31_01725 [Candidatus Yanofskybacteria bacterium CG10_big_fil_rev_8_21_14_0_10_46_23]